MHPPSPRWLTVLLTVVLSAASVRAATPAVTPDPHSPEFPAYAMARVDDLYRGLRSHGTLEMHVKTVHWERSMTLESWSLGKEYSLVRILAPKKDRGTATLKAKGELFTYLSETGRTIKITSGMMGGSWMGSHFTNDDLVRETRLSDDFTITLAFDGDAAGQKVYRFSLVPRPDRPVVWGTIEVTLRQADLQPIGELFFDEEGKKVRELTFAAYRDVGGRMLPGEMTMRPLDGSGEFTQIVWKQIDFNVQLEESFFTVRQLRAM